ncbi:MAG: NADH-quinone oxidoreductase subunit C [Planctomycetota bacterium]|nr:NADH-quinone oxidoreductase subunit C [Planctomycetota bacterium]
MSAPDTIASNSIAALQARFPEAKESEFRNQHRVVVPVAALYEVLAFLKNEQQFDLLVDITCVDYLNYRDATDRFGLVYVVSSTTTNEQLIVRTFLNEPNLTVPTVMPLWIGADWMEREVWDMFGIIFDGHPDHRRILLPEEFTAHPLRKDYPLQGRGERHNFPVLHRIEG